MKKKELVVIDVDFFFSLYTCTKWGWMKYSADTSLTMKDRVFLQKLMEESKVDIMQERPPCRKS